MNDIIYYFINMIPYMIISIPIFIIVRFIIYRRNKKINWHREIAMLLFTIFLSGLGSQTAIPKFEVGVDGGLTIIKNGISEINIVPFKVLIDTYREVFVNGYINYFIINFLGNIIMFIPIGFFIPLLWKLKSKKVIFIGFAISFFIEFCQLFLTRGTDVDDLILNTIGAILGLYVYNLLSKSLRVFFNKFKDNV